MKSFFYNAGTKCNRKITYKEFFLLSFSDFKEENLFTDDVPPPGAYDPKFDSKVKSFVIDKSERFDSKSVASEDSNVTICSKHANTVAPTFRTVRNQFKNFVLIPCKMLI